MSELSPQAEARDVELATTKGAASWTRRTFPLGGRWPAGPDEGAEGRTPIIPVGTLISLASLDSFPLSGGNHYGAHTVRPYG